MDLNEVQRPGGKQRTLYVRDALGTFASSKLAMRIWLFTATNKSESRNSTRDRL
jgi:hypothetical protein